MRFSWKRTRLALVAAASSVLMLVSSAGVAHANEPGESTNWVPQNQGGQNLMLRGYLSEARSANGHLMHVWLGEDNNNLYLSVDNGPGFTVPFSTQTNVAPALIPFGTSGFMIFHVGTDHHIYYIEAIVGDHALTFGSNGWVQVPGQSTHNSVSVVQTARGSTNRSFFLAYRSDTDNRIFGLEYDNGQWGGNTDFAGALSPQQPAVAYNPYSARTYIVIRGMDNQIWMNYRDIWGNLGPAWVGQGNGASGVGTNPEIAVLNGNMLVSYAGFDEHVYYRGYYSDGTSNQGWMRDLTSWQTTYAVTLSVVNGIMYALLTGLGHQAYYKQVWNGKTWG